MDSMARDLLIVLYDGVQSLDVTGPWEVFAHAGYRVVSASWDGRLVTASSGLRLLPDRALTWAERPDTLLVPGGAGSGEQPELVRWLRVAAAASRRVVSVCTGAFALAAAGVLDGRRVTTHWQHAARLADRYPAVRVEPDAIYVRDGPVATSAGVTAGIDLALALVEEDLGRDTALRVARELVVFLRRPGNQSQFSAQLRAQYAQRRPLREVQHWIEGNPAADLDVETLAARASLSPRHFARAFAAEVGVTPGRYVDQVRLETARRLLEDSRDGVETVSRAAGYGTPEAMRRAFVRELGVAPAEYRRRFV
jgi:transcriptional regulator GlxA family with amidase domain